MSLLYSILKPIVYFPGGGSRRWQLPFKNSMKNYIRCGVTDYEIKIKEGMFHAWPVFTFTKEGREGEREIIMDINAFFHREISDKNAQKAGAAGGRAYKSYGEE